MIVGPVFGETTPALLEETIGANFEARPGVALDVAAQETEGAPDGRKVA